MYEYIEDANKKLKQNISIPALPRVQKLLSEYDSTINEKLRCYYDKAKRPVTERSVYSTEPSVTEISNLSRESQEIISRIMQDHAEQILDIVATEHNIPIEECLEYMPLLIHDISRYYQNQLILEPDYDSLAMSKNDEQVLKHYEKNLAEVVDSDGQRRLELPLPWKEGYPISIPESVEVARRRLVTQTRTAAQLERASKCCETFEKMKKEGHAKLEEEEEEERTGESSVHYLTHFATDQEKFRVVYNGALKINGVSINDMLHRGPMFLESLVGIVIRFRQHPVAITADIKNMLFQIRLHPKDRIC